MENRVDIEVFGQPKGQPRPRAFANGGRARVYDPGTAEGWKGAVALAVRPYLPEGGPVAGPVRVSITYDMPRPKRLYRKKDPEGTIPHTSKPDLDNMDKAVLDSLTAVGFWLDDAQVIRLSSEKRYHGKQGRPGARIEIEY